MSEASNKCLDIWVTFLDTCPPFSLSLITRFMLKNILDGSRIVT
jgi:hypothetical protein